MSSVAEVMDYRLVKFLLVGVLNTLFGYSVFAVLVYLGLHYTLAVFLSTVLGVLFNFQTFGKLVFKHSGNSRLFRFILSYIILYFTNILCIKFFLVLTHNVYVSGAFALIVAATLSYLLNSRWVFAPLRTMNNE